MYQFKGSIVSLEEIKQPKESLCAQNLDILTDTLFYVGIKPVTLQFQDTFLNSGPRCRPVTSPPDFHLADTEAPVSFSISGKV